MNKPTAIVILYEGTLPQENLVFWINERLKVACKAEHVVIKTYDADSLSNLCVKQTFSSENATTDIDAEIASMSVINKASEGKDTFIGIVIALSKALVTWQPEELVALTKALNWAHKAKPWKTLDAPKQKAIDLMWDQYHVSWGY